MSRHRSFAAQRPWFGSRWFWFRHRGPRFGRRCRRLAGRFQTSGNRCRLSASPSDVFSARCRPARGRVGPTGGTRPWFGWCCAPPPSHPRQAVGTIGSVGRHLHRRGDHRQSSVRLCVAARRRTVSADGTRPVFAAWSASPTSSRCWNMTTSAAPTTALASPCRFSLGSQRQPSGGPGIRMVQPRGGLAGDVAGWPPATTPAPLIGDL